MFALHYMHAVHCVHLSVPRMAYGRYAYISITAYMPKFVKITNIQFVEITNMTFFHSHFLIYH